jgi:uncharacterized membrane protein YfcA
VATLLQALAETDPGQIAVAVLAAFAGGCIRGFVGFGGALVTILVLSVLLGPQAAVAVAALSGLPAMLQLLPAAVRDAERRFVVPFALATFLAAPAGTLVLVSVEPGLMKMAIAGFVLVMVAMLWRGWALPASAGLAGTIAAGVASGFIQGSSGIGGPPAVAAALARPGSAVQQRANTIGAVSGLNLCALVPLYLFGVFTPAVLVFSLLSIPAYSGGTWLGARYFSIGGQRHYRNAALLLLALTGAVTFVIAASDHFAA